MNPINTPNNVENTITEFIVMNNGKITQEKDYLFATCIKVGLSYTLTWLKEEEMILISATPETLSSQKNNRLRKFIRNNETLCFKVDNEKNFVFSQTVIYLSIQRITQSLLEKHLESHDYQWKTLNLLLEKHYEL
jgi:hypothetical protein